MNPAIPPIKPERKSGMRSRLRRILLVEDNPDHRSMYGSRMRAAGWDVRELESGAHALEVALTFAPDVVVTDLTMPELDGAAATRQLKDNVRTAGVPIVVLSGYIDRAWEAYRAGCHTFLTKPCLPEVLLNVIDSAVRDEQSSSGGGQGEPGG